MFEFLQTEFSYKEASTYLPKVVVDIFKINIVLIAVHKIAAPRSNVSQFFSQSFPETTDTRTCMSIFCVKREVF